MGDKSKIEWTDATWNPVTGCTKVSAGCARCYAERIFARPYPGRKFTDIRCHPERLDQPLRWKRPRRIFVNSMSDLFHEQVPFQFIDRVFAVMMLAQHHTFQVLTKRPERMKQYANSIDRYRAIARECREELGFEPLLGVWPPRNVWMGTSIENQDTAEIRIPLLAQIEARMKFLSIEPLLGPISLYALDMGEGYQFNCLQDKFLFGDRGPINWVIVGGESGPKSRPMDIEWARLIRAQCVDAKVPFFMKQLSQGTTGSKYKDYSLFPKDLQIRQFPRSYEQGTIFTAM